MGCAGSKPSPAAPPPVRGVQRPVPEPVPRAKLVLLGDSGVGKSCLVMRYVRGAFDPSSKVTVGAAFISHSIALPNGRTIKFEIWDTAGQERYASLAPLYYRGASAAIVVYDVTSKDTFAKAKHWIQELHKNASGNLVIVLVGNKTDLVEEREVAEEEGKELADRGGMLFIETSAKTAANCSTVFESIAKKLAGYTDAATPPEPARPREGTPETPTSIPPSSGGSPPQ